MQIIFLTNTLLLVSLYANWLLPFLQYSTSQVSYELLWL